MSFKSKTQMKMMFANDPKMAKEWASKMTKEEIANLPEYAKGDKTENMEFSNQVQRRMIEVLTNISHNACWSPDDSPWLEEKTIDFVAGAMGLNTDPCFTDADQKSRFADWTSSLAETTTDNKDRKAFVDHAVAMQAHKDAGKAQMRMGNEDKAVYHFNKASEHRHTRRQLVGNGGPGSGRKGHKTDQEEGSERYAKGDKAFEKKASKIAKSAKVTEAELEEAKLADMKARFPDRYK